MRFSELIPLTAAVTNLALTLFVLTRDLRSTLNRVYLLWGLSITVWNLGTFFLFSVQDEGAARFWSAFLHYGVIFLPVSLFHLSCLIAQVKLPRWLPVLYGWFGLLALANAFGVFTSGVRNLGYAYYSTAGPGFWAFVASYVVVTTSTVFILLRKLQTLQRLHRARVKALLWANGILIGFGWNDILPIVGVDTYPLTRVAIFPFGSAAAIFYGIIVGYSVLQHHLLDIHVTLGKAAAHAVRLLFLFLIGLLLLLLLNVFARGEFTPFTFFGSLGVLLVSALVASIFFPRLFGKGDESLEQRILSDRYGDRFEYHDKVRSFLQEAQFYNNADLLLNDLHALFVKTIRVRNYHIILLDESTHVFTVFRGHPKEAQVQLPELRADSPIFQLFHFLCHLLEVVRSQLWVAHHLLHALSLHRVPSFLGQFGCEVLSRGLHRESFIPHVDALLLQSLFGLVIKLNAQVVLHCRLFTDPEPHMVREPFVEMSSWQQCVSHASNTDFLGPRRAFEEAVEIWQFICGFTASLLARGFWGEQHLPHSLVKFLCLNHFGRDFDLHVQTADVVEVGSLAQHFEGECHR